MMFRGYVLTKNKKCLQSFKNVPSDELLTLEQATQFSEYAGIISDDFVLIDVDDLEQSELLMKIVEEEELLCRVYETTRGKHFFFKNADKSIKNQKIKGRLPIGINADVKPGCVNTYSILKFDGKDRPIIYDIFEGEEYQEVPKWLIPLSRKTSIELRSLKDGDGRNDALFRYIQTLEKEGLTKDEIKNVLRLINKYVFDKPLSQSEFDTITRDEAFSPSVSAKNLKFNVFAHELAKKHHLKRMNGRIYIYRDGIYVESTDEIQRAMIEMAPDLTYANRIEILRYLQLIVNDTLRDDEMSASADYIAFKNGVLNIVTDEFSDFSPEYAITNKIDWNYNPEAKSDVIDKVLDQLSCNSREIRDLMEEMIGYTFYRRNELRKAFVLVGDKANGKSTLLNMIINVLGQSNVSSLDLAELDSQYNTAEIFGRLANIGDDIKSGKIRSSAMFKKLVSGDRISARRIYESPFEFFNYSKFIFSSNDIPQMKDYTGAVMDRLIIIPFKATFNKNSPNYDPYIKYKLRSAECMEYLIQLGVKALKRVLENETFTICDEVKKELDEYQLSANPILNFFMELDRETEVVGTPTKELYIRYDVWCIENGVKKISNIEFSRVVKRHYKVTIKDKKVGGVKKRVFA